MNKNKKEDPVPSSPDPCPSAKEYKERGYIPVTPRMLVKSLENLKQSKIHGLCFKPKQIAEFIRETYPCVQQNFTMLFLEVTDKLICAASADFIGCRDGVGYYPFNLKQCGARLDSRSELTFWVLYKRILDQRRQMKEKAKKRSEIPSNEFIKKRKINSKKLRKKKKKKCAKIISVT